MKALLSTDNIIILEASRIEWGVWDEPNLEKWALFDADGNIMMYAIDNNFTVVDFDETAKPEDYDYGKYFLVDGEFVENPDYVAPPLSNEEQLQLHGEAITALYQSSEVATIAFVLMAENGMVDDVTASEHAEVFDTWRGEGVAYKVGNIRRDGDYLYRCLTDHISQASWTPAASPSLWVRISDPAEEYPLWSQPIGSTDAYMKGDKVTFEGKHYVSDYDNNTWSPATFGWTEVTE